MTPGLARHHDARQIDQGFKVGGIQRRYRGPDLGANGHPCGLRRGRCAEACGQHHDGAEYGEEDDTMGTVKHVRDLLDADVRRVRAWLLLHHRHRGGQAEPPRL